MKPVVVAAVVVAVVAVVVAVVDVVVVTDVVVVDLAVVLIFIVVFAVIYVDVGIVIVDIVDFDVGVKVVFFKMKAKKQQCLLYHVYFLFHESQNSTLCFINTRQSWILSFLTACN